jgi:hypothetical protein
MGETETVQVVDRLFAEVWGDPNAKVSAASIPRWGRGTRRLAEAERGVALALVEVAGDGLALASSQARCR